MNDEYIKGYKKCLLDIRNQMEDYAFAYKGKDIRFNKTQRAFIKEFCEMSIKHGFESAKWGGLFPYLYYNKIKWSDLQPFCATQYTPTDSKNYTIGNIRKDNV